MSIRAKIRPGSRKDALSQGFEGSPQMRYNGGVDFLWDVTKKGGGMRFPFEQHVAAWGSRRLFRLSVLLAVAALAAIYLFSLQSPVQSLMLSGRFSRLLLRLTGRQFDEHLLRKLAHVAEYALLGMLAGLALAQTDWGARQAFKLLLAGMLAAFLDESLQLLSGRGASILDVWIDTLGVMAGLAVILAFFSPRRPPPAS